MVASVINFRKLFKYLSSKTLIPCDSLINRLPHHSQTLHTLPPSRVPGISCPSSCSFASQILQNRPSGDCRKLTIYNLSCGLPSNCSIDSYQLNKKRVICNFSKGSYSKRYLTPPTFLSAGILYNYSGSSSYGGLSHCSVFLVKGYNRKVLRSVSASSDGESMIFDDSKEVYTVSGENKNVVHEVEIPSKKPRPPLRKACRNHSPGKRYKGGKEPKYLSPGKVSEIVNLVKKNENDMERQLNSVAQHLTIQSLILVFQSLNSQKVSGLGFFRLVQIMNSTLSRNADFCSLIVSNCGWLDDYGTMRSLLYEFKSQKICLSDLAFTFLPLISMSKNGTYESIERMIELLNEVGGSCRSSGIHSLIQMLCTLDFFDMAKFVMEITEINPSRINVLIREKCKRGLVEEACGIIKEMRELGYQADSNSYNYILGKLCKMNRKEEAFGLFADMKETGAPPNTITFEILIHLLCNLGEINRAYQLFYQMVSEGLRPPFAVHAAIIKALIHTKQYEEAYMYVIDSSVKDPQSSPMIYTLLAKFHQKYGDIMSARKIALEMMGKGLRPNYNDYKRIVRSLEGSLATDLKNRYSRFISTSIPQLK